KFARDKGIKTYLESACYDSTRFAKVLPFIDIVKVEFKLNDSQVVDEKNYESLIRNELECLELSISSGKTTYIKVVVTNSSSLIEFKELVHKVFRMVKPTE